MLRLIWNLLTLKQKSQEKQAAQFSFRTNSFLAQIKQFRMIYSCTGKLIQLVFLEWIKTAYLGVKISISDVYV